MQSRMVGKFPDSHYRYFSDSVQESIRARHGIRNIITHYTPVVIPKIGSAILARFALAGKSLFWRDSLWPWSGEGVKQTNEPLPHLPEKHRSPDPINDRFAKFAGQNMILTRVTRRHISMPTPCYAMLDRRT